MKRSKVSDEQILAIVKEGEAGRKVADLCRTHGITEQTYYRWKSKYGGLGAERAATAQAARGRESPTQTHRRRADAGHSGVESGGGKKVVGPVAKRGAVGWLIDAQRASLRRACRLVGLSTATWRYERRGRVDNRELLARLQAQAAVRPRYGYRRLHTLIAREGLIANHKRVHRVYCEAGLHVRRRRRKRLSRGERVPLSAPTGPRQRWSMDFMADTLADGRGFRTLNIVDDFTRECVAIEVDRSLPGARVVRVLERLAMTIGLPPILVSDNGPEFAGRTLNAWAYRHGIELRFIRPGKPIENAYVESFNGKFRDECLNEHWFLSLAEAQQIIEAWRVDDNTVRPHRSLGQLTPAAYAAAACAGPAAGWGACSAAAPATFEQPRRSDGLSLSV